MKKILSEYWYLIFLFMPLLATASDNKNQETLKKEVELQKEKSLVVSVQYGNGHIYLDKTDSKNVYEGQFVYDEQYPDVRYEVVGDQGRLNIHFSGKMKKGVEDDDSQSISSFKNIYDNQLDLKLTEKIPLEMDMELGMVKGDMNLGGLKLRHLNMEVGVSQSSVLFDEPNPEILESCYIEGGVGKLMVEKIGNSNFQYFSFEGGVGSYILDFSGDYRRDASANIELGMGKLTLYLPKYVGTRVKVDKSFLASLSIDDCYKKSSYYYNDMWEKTANSLDVKIETGVGKIDIQWVEK